jgi:hypothetical protein
MPKINLNKYQPIDHKNEFYWDSYYDRHYDDFDDLSKRENRAANLARRYGDMWNVMDYRNYKNPSPYKIAERILRKNIGKSFDSAFSYYCKQVDIQYQTIFLKEVKRDCGRYRYYSKFFIDDDGLIRHSCHNKSKKVNFESVDYKTTWVHKKTDHDKSEFRKVYKEATLNSWRSHKEILYYSYGDNNCLLKPLHERYIAKEDDFKLKVISGYSLTFSSKNDSKYRRLQTEFHKAKLRAEKQAKLAKRSFDYTSIIRDNTIKGIMSREEFKRKQLAIAKKEEELNTIKIISHGFDPKTSFKKL